MLIRPATAKDAKDVAEVFLRARERMKYLPELQTAEETRALFRDVVATREVLVLEKDERVLGFAAVRDEWLEHLYVHPLAQGFGIGTALLERAKASRKGGLKTWVFQKNSGARRFYERAGFELEKLTDGAENEEQEPDALYTWAGEK
jgi:GNAT superfamily N-acetyltransferase